MKIVNFKKTAAGIMSVAMMLSATVLPGTVENLPAISNVLTASADSGSSSISRVSLGGDRGYFTIEDYSQTIGDTTTSWQVLKFENATELNGEVVAIKDSLKNPLFIYLNHSDKSSLQINRSAFEGMTIDSLYIGAGTKLAANALNGAVVKKLVIDYDSSISFDEKAFAGVDFSQLEEFSFNGTDANTNAAYDAFYNSLSETAKAKIDEINAKNNGEPGEGQHQLPDGASVTMSVSIGEYVGGTFQVQAPPHKDMKVMFRESKADKSSITAYNRNYEVIARDGGTANISFYISPKNIADPIYYIVQLADPESDPLLQNFQQWQNTSFHGSTSVDYYLSKLETESASDDSKYSFMHDFVVATRNYGRAAYDYFEYKAAHGDDRLYGATDPEGDESLVKTCNAYAPKDQNAFNEWCYAAKKGDTYWFNDSAALKSTDNSTVSIYLMGEARTRFQVKENTGNGIFNLIYESQPIAAWDIGKIFDYDDPVGYTINNNGQKINYNGEPFKYSVMMWVNAYHAAAQSANASETIKINDKLGQAVKAFGYEASLVKEYIDKLKQNSSNG